jgi:hypothetical protein
LGRYEFILLRTRDSFAIPIGGLKGHFHHTHDLVVEDVAPHELRRVQRMVEEITELLSFGTLSHVAKFGYTYRGSTVRRSVRGVSLFFRPAFTEGEEIRGLLEQAWSTYRRLRIRRKLHVVIDYLVTAETGQPLEVQLLIMSAVLECLKSTYAAATGYKYCKPAWRRISAPSRVLRNEPKVGFEELLREMLRVVRMRRSLRRLIQLRNDIVHTGISRRPYPSQFASYEAAQELVREYLLRLFGYRGSYYGYSTRAMRTV